MPDYTFIHLFASGKRATWTCSINSLGEGQFMYHTGEVFATKKLTQKETREMKRWLREVCEGAIDEICNDLYDHET